MADLKMHLLGAVAMSVLVACGGGEADEAGPIPLSNETGDDTFIAGTEAKLLDEGDRQFLIVPAKRGNSEDNRGPLLKATVDFGSGEATCEAFRDTIWGNFTDFEDLTLECEEFPIEDAASATLVP